MKITDRETALIQAIAVALPEGVTVQHLLRTTLGIGTESHIVEVIAPTAMLFALMQAPTDAIAALHEPMLPWRITSWQPHGQLCGEIGWVRRKWRVIMIKVA